MSIVHLMQFQPKLTLDGLLTFVGGLLAFIVIWRQTRHADQGLAKQLEAERTAQLEDTARRRRAVAKALIFEIDNFYRIYLSGPYKALKDVDPNSCEVSRLPALKTPSENPFPVYKSNADSIGDLDEREVRNIVRYFGEADSYIRTLREYRLWYDKLVLEGSTYAPVNQAARAYLTQMKNVGPEMIGLTFVVLKGLCRMGGVAFSPSIIAVAEEPYAVAGATTSDDAKER